jgi:hypothetical protein
LKGILLTEGRKPDAMADPKLEIAIFEAFAHAMDLKNGP